jgi:hypothetical protein
VQASNATADLESGMPQQAGMLASTLSAAPEFTASQAYSNIMPFGRCRALVLDSSYRPIDVVNWQRAICLDLFDKVYIDRAMFEAAHLRRYMHALSAVLVDSKYNARAS